MEILLGVFNQDFYNFARQIKAETYPFSRTLIREYGYEETQRIRDGSLLNLINQAGKASTIINFRLNAVQFPLEPLFSITCKELDFILSEPELLSKTQFWLGNKKIKTETVINKHTKSIQSCQQLEPTNESTGTQW